MRRIAALVFALVCGLATIGCAHASGQIPSNPTVNTCPTPNGTNYTPLNQSTPATTLAYTDSPGAGVWCYIAQSVLGSNSSVPSNTTPPTTVATGQNVNLAWTAPTTGPAPSGYVLSRTAAVQTTLGAPTIAAPTASAQLAKPIPLNGELALNSPMLLQAQVNSVRGK